MIYRLFKKIITAPLHIVAHSYKRAQQGFAYLMKQPGYVQYGPDAKPADGQAYVSPPFLQEAPSVHHPVEFLSESEDDEPHLDANDLAFLYKSALNGFTTEYEYVTKNQKNVSYPDFADKVFGNLIENIEENIKENNNVHALLRARVQMDDGESRWISTKPFGGVLNKFTTREQLVKL
jgi:hypothetical protein